MKENLRFLQSDRVYLRHFQKEDYKLIEKALLNPEIRKMTGAQRIFTLSKIEKAYNAFAEDNNRIDLVICLVDGDEPIGDLSLNEIDLLNRNANIRIALHEEKFFGKGYGTDALKLILEYGFFSLNLYRIGLNVYEFNARAQKSYEKLGFKQEGILRGELFYNGEYHNNIIMGILRHEYEKSKESHS